MISWKQTLTLSFLLTLAVWLFFSWPLPRYFNEGIPSSTANVEKGAVRRMFQGDHLQLLYNYWLIADMMSGQTPWLHNVYEFNTGDDAARKYVGIDDAPFVFFFAFLHAVGGRAFAWNATQFVALWLTHLFSWLLLRRYVRSQTMAALLALLVITLSFRWTSLFGGSPTGFAMTWIPLWMWGLDAAIRRGRITGGVLAGLAVVFISWNDAHVFFFSVLAIPCWFVGVLLLDDEFPWKTAYRWKQASVACVPFVLLAGSVLMIGQLKHANLAETTFEAGREWREVALYSPKSFGLWTWRTFGHESQLYIGMLLPVLLIMGLFAQLRQMAREPRSQWRHALALVLLLGACAAIIVLALGTHGPRGGWPLAMVRRLIPPYAMIRQPAKIFCLMPNLLALAAALGWHALAESVANRRWHMFMLPAIVSGITIEHGFQIRPTVCLLDTQQGAYAAVAEDAKDRNKMPRAIVLPIWPGDSSWASLYEHYVSLYRIRMINGYQPAVPKEYIENVFTVFESFNCGLLDESQRAALKRFGIEYVLLHEDAFPEKVSWFPVAFTLKQLLNHPHLRLLRQDQNVWAFRLLDEPQPRDAELAPHWQIFFPNYHHEMEWSGTQNIGEDEAASGNRYLRLSASDARITLRSFEHLRAPNAALLLRCRGKGQLAVGVRYDEGNEQWVSQDIAFSDWGWVSIALPDFANSLRLTASFAVSSGTLDLDMIIYASGQLPEISVGDSFSLPAPLFFHAGYTDLSNDCVTLRREYEPADVIVYGPKLPLPPGQYVITMEYAANAPAGTQLGSFYIETEKGRTPEWPVILGREVAGEFSSITNTLPITLRFRYSREADMRIRRFTFTRVH